MHGHFYVYIHILPATDRSVHIPFQVFQTANFAGLKLNKDRLVAAMGFKKNKCVQER